MFIASALAVFIGSGIGQDVKTGSITTNAVCSPVIVAPKGSFSIRCTDPTLTKAQAQKEAQQISEILTRLRGSAGDNDSMSLKLDQIIRSLDEIKTASLPRHLTPQQHEQIGALSRKFENQTIGIGVNTSDLEAEDYYDDFIHAFQNAKLYVWSRIDNAMRFKGLVFQINPDDLKSNQIPSLCGALAEALQIGPIRKTFPLVGDPVVPKGVCRLIVGTKEQPTASAQIQP